jgi:hypothetical protein
MDFVITVLADVVEFSDLFCLSEMPYTRRIRYRQAQKSEKKPIPFENRLKFNPKYVAESPTPRMSDIPYQKQAKIAILLTLPRVYLTIYCAKWVITRLSWKDA